MIKLIEYTIQQTCDTSEDAKQWDGWGTALALNKKLIILLLRKSESHIQKNKRRKTMGKVVHYRDYNDTGSYIPRTACGFPAHNYGIYWSYEIKEVTCKSCLKTKLMKKLRGEQR